MKKEIIGEKNLLNLETEKKDKRLNLRSDNCIFGKYFETYVRDCLIKITEKKNT